jgi:hypothetical protein
VRLCLFSPSPWKQYPAIAEVICGDLPEEARRGGEAAGAAPRFRELRNYATFGSSAGAALQLIDSAVFRLF